MQPAARSCKPLLAESRSIGPTMLVRPPTNVQPTLTQNGGAIATIQAFTADNLFLNQSKAFFDLVMEVASAADAVQHEGDD